MRISVVDDNGTVVIGEDLDEVSRLDAARDPLLVFVRLEALTERALASLHDQALGLAGGSGGTWSGVGR